jgi:hypothetical protein
MTAVAGSTDCVAYTAVCQREGDWWVVTVPELEAGGVTQGRTLDEVPETVADLVATMTGADPASVEITVQAHAGPGLNQAASAVCRSPWLASPWLGAQSVTRWPGVSTPKSSSQ